MEMNKKMTKCAYCGADIAKSATICLQCGARNNKPIYKRTWFIVLCVLAVLIVVVNLGGQSDTKVPDNTAVSDSGKTPDSSTKDPVIEYTNYEVNELIDDLSDNALKAQKKYAKAYVKLTGKLNVIDSSGKYISIVPTNKKFSILGVQCYINGEEQLNKVMEMKIGDTVTLKGKITSVGEVIGYSLNIDIIE